jgi:hypothetical protein
VLSRWLSPRSLLLHLVMVVWVFGCATAAWWQIGRAQQGNALSYTYAVEWPVLAVAGVVIWWKALHRSAESPGDRAARESVRTAQVAEVQAQKRHRDDEDPELAAYNDRLAELAASGRRKSWRN